MENREISKEFSCVWTGVQEAPYKSTFAALPSEEEDTPAVSGEPELLSRKMDQVVATLIVNTARSAGCCHAAVCWDPSSSWAPQSVTHWDFFFLWQVALVLKMTVARLVRWCVMVFRTWLQPTSAVPWEVCAVGSTLEGEQLLLAAIQGSLEISRENWIWLLQRVPPLLMLSSRTQQGHFKQLLIVRWVHLWLTVKCFGVWREVTFLRAFVMRNCVFWVYCWF